MSFDNSYVYLLRVTDNNEPVLRENPIAEGISVFQEADEAVWGYASW